MTGKQLGVLVILAVLLLLVVTATLVFALGLFDGTLVPALPTEPSQGTTSELNGTPSPGEPGLPTAVPTSITLSPQITGTPSVLSTQLTPTSETPSATPSHTSTPLADICALLDLRFISSTSNIAAWQLQNDSGTTPRVTRIELDWPKSNDAIFNTLFDGKVIWSDVDQTPPTIMTTWIGAPEDRSVDRLTRVEFFFGTLAAPGGYDLYLWFDNGCEISAAN